MSRNAKRIWQSDINMAIIRTLNSCEITKKIKMKRLCKAKQARREFVK